jgi:hypothetical protein
LCSLFLNEPVNEPDYRLTVLDGRTKDEFIYPVAMYDHDEGVAISGGFAYNGKIPALGGKFVFGDINRGRVRRRDRGVEAG